MAKRLTDTDKWKDDWFLSLSNDYRMIWLYMLDNCSHAGILKKSFGLMNFCCNTKITEEEFNKVFDGRVKDCGNFYVIPKFIFFQYNDLTSNKPVVVSVRKELERLKINGMITESLHNDYGTIKDKSKSKDKVKDKVIEDRGVGEETKDITVPEVVKEPNQYYVFIDSFGKLYEKATGNPFNRQNKHFLIVKKLIDKHGFEETKKKALILAAYCQEGEMWFTKNGFADFTIEHLSSQWNSLLPQVRKSPEEISNDKVMENIKELRRRDELLKR